MGSSYLPPSEQNVVNVGDELSQAAIDAINAAVAPSGTNPFVTASEATGAGFSDYDNFKVYAAGDVVLASNDFYRFNTFIGAAGYGPITHPAAWTKLSASDLTGYAQLAGGTFTGKVSFTPASGVAGLNVGIGGTSAASTTNGDLWITTGGPNLNFRDGTGAWKVLASLQNGNVFSAVQTVNVTSASPALLVKQLGSGDAFRVEDENPENSPFVINQFGRVGIGVAPDVYAALKVDNGGIKFSDNSVLTSVAGLQSAITQAVINTIFSGSAVYGGSGSVYAQYTYFDSTLNGGMGGDIFVDYLSYTYTYYVAWNSISMVFSQTTSSPTYPALYNVVGSFSTSGGSMFNIRADGVGGVYDVVQV